MRLLVVGANGLLGSNVVRAGQAPDWTVAGTYHSTRPGFEVPLTEFDLEQAGSFDAILEERDPDIVVNCAAMTDVDACETDPERAHAVNGEAPGEVAARCDAADVEYVHVSTDYVFDGDAENPYPESAEPNPLQVYGASKLAGERAVRDGSTAPLLVRLSFVWGTHGATDELTGFPAWVRSRLESGQEVPLFTDQWVTPTRAGHAAETLLDLLEQDATGLYHVACTSCVTPYEFGELFADHLGAPEGLLAEGSTNDVERTAPRPTYTCLDVGAIESTLGRSQPTLRADVETL